MERKAIFEIWGTILFALLTVAILTIVAEREPARMEQRSASFVARQIEQGAALFQEHCRSCHGVMGEGIGELGPAINDVAFFTTRLDEVYWLGTMEEYLVQTISLGRMTATRPLYAGDGAMAMTPWLETHGGPLRPDEVQAVAAFVLNWEAGARGEFVYQPVEVPTPEAGDLTEQVARGQEVFVQAGCAECHAVPGVSESATGPGLAGVASQAAERLPGYTADAYLRESVLIPNGFRVAGYETAPTCGSVVSQAQLDDLVTFLLSLR